MLLLDLLYDVQQVALTGFVHQSDSTEKGEHGVQTTDSSENVRESGELENINLSHLMYLEDHRVMLMSFTNRFYEIHIRVLELLQANVSQELGWLKLERRIQNLDKGWMI